MSQLTVTARWGDYARLQAEAPAEETEEEASGKRRRRAHQRWKRIPIEVAGLELDLAVIGKLARQRIRPDDEIYLEHVVRPLGTARAVSVFLVNRRVRPDQGRPPADTWIFQPGIRIAADGHTFLPREPEPLEAITDADMESNALLFRGRREFAVGHGTAVTWEEAGPEAAHAIETMGLPGFELPQVVPHAIPNVAFDMAALAAAPNGETLAQLLRPLVEAYREWISTKRSEVAGLNGNLQPTASQHLDMCENAAERDQRGP